MKYQEAGGRCRGELDSQFQRAVQKLKAVRRFSIEDCEPCRIVPGLYIGSIGAARNLQALQHEGITHILNASPIVPCFHRRQLRYKHVVVYDDAQEDIAQFFDETNRYIAKGRKRGGVLVHCYAGMSRSATFVLAYLVACERMDLTDALHLTKKARPCVDPNSGFMAQLERFSQQLGLRAEERSCSLYTFAAASAYPPSLNLTYEPAPEGTPSDWEAIKCM